MTSDSAAIEMAPIHRIFRCQSAAVARLVRAIDPVDRGHLDVVAGHLRFLLDGLRRGSGSASRGSRRSRARSPGSPPAQLVEVASPGEAALMFPTLKTLGHLVGKRSSRRCTTPIHGSAG